MVTHLCEKNLVLVTTIQPVSHDHIAAQVWSSSRSAFLKLTADHVLGFDWIAVTSQVNVL